MVPLLLRQSRHPTTRRGVGLIPTGRAAIEGHSGATAANIGRRMSISTTRISNRTIVPPCPSSDRTCTPSANKGRCIVRRDYHSTNVRGRSSRSGIPPKYTRDRHTSVNALGFRIAAGIGIAAGTISTVAMAYCEPEQEGNEI